ncbi:MAG: 'Sigma54 specific transcriptional regulator, Fis family [Leptospirillum sp. Group IV 'UBA BS']|nr:MAG: 'Sigma54 specific transcriptional regulator, Fis family [Leptospirillum sp. Group IV 'UBA BS']
MRRYDRLPLDVAVLFRGPTGGFRKGILRNLSLTGCFIEPARKVDFSGWVRLRIDGDEDRRISGIAPVETWGLMARKDEAGFAIHFNWIERENLRRFAPDHPVVTKMLEINQPSPFLGPTPSGTAAEFPKESFSLDNQVVERLLRNSWSSFIEFAPAEFFDGMIDWFSDAMDGGEKAEKEEPVAFPDWFFPSRSPEIGEIVRKLRMVAPSGLPILLLGETGVGKEMYARLCHEVGGRPAAPFVPVNCGAIPMDLAESLFFGHEKGSFSGAVAQAAGHLEAAGKGTLFLDEIGELSPALQVKLLRVLQERTFTRVGSSRELPFEARVVCATNRNLSEEVKKGRFREDLFYRINGLTLEIPPLRNRISDILPMAEYFLKKICQANKLPEKSIGAAAAAALQSYAWPGNARELHNVVYRAAVIADGPEIREEDVGLPLEKSAQAKPTLKEIREIFEKEVVLESLVRHNGNVAAVAYELDISKPSVYLFIKKHKLSGKFTSLPKGEEDSPLA